MLERQGISISLFLSRVPLAFWAGCFRISCPHVFKNTPWGRGGTILNWENHYSMCTVKNFFFNVTEKQGKLQNKTQSTTVMTWRCITKCVTLWCVCSWTEWTGGCAKRFASSVLSAPMRFDFLKKFTFSLLRVSFYQVNRILFGETKSLIHSQTSGGYTENWDWVVPTENHYENKDGKTARGTNVFLTTCLSHKSPFPSLLNW